MFRQPPLFGREPGQIGNQVRCPKSIARIDLRNMRSSCQISYDANGPIVGNNHLQRPKRSAAAKRAALAASGKSEWEISALLNKPPPVFRAVTPEDIMNATASSFNASSRSSTAGTTRPSTAGGNRSHRSIGLDRSSLDKGSLDRSGDSAGGRARPRTAGGGRRHRAKSPSRGGRPAPAKPHSHVFRDNYTRRALMAEESVRRANERPADTVLLDGTVMRRTALLQLQTESAFTGPQLQHLMKVFHRHMVNNKKGEMNKVRPQSAGATELAEGSIGREAFQAALSTEFNVGDRTVLDRLFDSFDTDGGGTIDYREFALGCAGLTRTTGGSGADKTKLLFQIYDTDGSGDIQISELLSIAEHRGLSMNESTQLVRNLLDSLDRDESGNISYQEFIEETATMPVLLQAFHELLPRPKRGAHSVISVLCDEHDFNFDRLTQLSTFLHREAMASHVSVGTRLHGGNEVDRGGFKLLMERFFGYHDMLLADEMFDVFDTNKNGYIDFHELLHGISGAMDGSLAEQAKFYFNLYDMDKSGNVDPVECYKLLLRSNDRVAGAGALDKKALERMLNSHGLGGMDSDSDGKISFDEFMAFVHKNDQTFHAFGKVL